VNLVNQAVLTSNPSLAEYAALEEEMPVNPNLDGPSEFPDHTKVATLVDCFADSSVLGYRQVYTLEQPWAIQAVLMSDRHVV